MKFGSQPANFAGVCRRQARGCLIGTQYTAKKRSGCWVLFVRDFARGETIEPGKSRRLRMVG